MLTASSFPEHQRQKQQLSLPSPTPSSFSDAFLSWQPLPPWVTTAQSSLTPLGVTPARCSLSTVICYHPNTCSIWQKVTNKRLVQGAKPWLGLVVSQLKGCKPCHPCWGAAVPSAAGLFACHAPGLDISGALCKEPHRCLH